jgi:hypothetical protein
MLLPAYADAALVEASPSQPRRPHTIDGSLLDQDGYNSTRTSLTFYNLILQVYEYLELVVFPRLLLVGLVRACLHLAVAPPLLTGLSAEGPMLLPHFVHPLGSPLVYCLVALRLHHSPKQPSCIPHQRARVGIFAHHSCSHLHLLVDSINSPEPTHPLATMQTPGDTDNTEVEAARARRQAQVAMADLSTASTRDSDAYMALTDARGNLRRSNPNQDARVASLIQQRIAQLQASANQGTAAWNSK